jgi:DNA repair exonuclease SbcCD ATPase subunit
LNDGKFTDGEEIKDLDCIKIGLYHGIINKSVVSKTGIKLNSEIGIKDFKNYTYVMLGDIHYHQYCNVNKTIAYAGSLISQNFGESYDEHGYLEWDLINRTSYYHKIKNDYQYKIFIIENEKIKINNIFYDNINQENKILIPHKGNIKILYDNIQSLKKFQKEIENILPEVKITSNINQVNKQEIKLINKYEINNMIIEYLNTICNKEQETKDNILEEINKLPKNIKELNEKSSYWELLELKFDNMYGFGENNYINFEYEHECIININAPNSYGKSSILDIITFMLYSSSARGDGNCPKDIINKSCILAKGELKIKINNKIYNLEKIINTSQNIQFKIYSLNDNKYISKNTAESNKYIIDIIGERKNFIFTCLLLQNDTNNIFNLAPKEKKKFISSLMNINIFDDKTRTNINTKIIELKTKINNLEKETLKDINEIKLNILYLEEEINKLEIENNLLDNIKDINNKKIEEISLKQKIITNAILIDDNIDYNLLLLEKQNKLKHYNLELNILGNKSNNLKNVKEQNKILIDNQQFTEKNNLLLLEYNNNKLDLRHKLKIEKEENLLLLNEKYNKLLDENKEILNILEIKQLSCKEFNIYKDLYKIKDVIELISKDYKKILDKHKNNILIQELKTTNLKYLENYDNEIIHLINKCIIIDQNIKELKENIDNIILNKNIKEEIKNIEKNIQDIIIIKYEPYELLKKELIEFDNIKIEIEKNNTLILNIKNTIQEIELIINQKETILNNINIQKIKEENNNILNKYKNNNKLLIHCNINLNNKKKEYEDYIKNIKELKLSINDLEKYNTIKEIISRNGLELFLLEKNLIIIQNIINEIIYPFINRTAKIYIKDEDIKIDYYKENQCINTLGGMEHFITQLSIKIAMSNIYIYPKLRTLFIDENISVMDKHHIENINIIYDFLKKYYNNVLIITHIEEAKKYIDYDIKIIKKNNNSYVNNKN